MHGTNYSASSMFVNNNVINYATVIRKYVFSFMKRLMSSGNEFLNSIYGSAHTDILYVSKIYAHWCNVLYI